MTNSIGSAWLVKIDSRGNMQWDKTIAGKSTTTANAIIQADDGAFILSGVDGNDAWLIKTSNSSDIPELTFVWLSLIIVFSIFVVFFSRKMLLKRKIFSKRIFSKSHLS
jgi:hypothetical protein